MAGTLPPHLGVLQWITFPVIGDTPDDDSQAIAGYHDGMTKKTTTVRLPVELASTVEVVARGRGISVNKLVVDALTAEVERVRHDEEFMGKLREITERDKEILDQLAQ